jgi:hypothetical protein
VPDDKIGLVERNGKGFVYIINDRITYPPDYGDAIDVDIEIDDYIRNVIFKDHIFEPHPLPGDIDPESGLVSFNEGFGIISPTASIDDFPDSTLVSIDGSPFWRPYTPTPPLIETKTPMPERWPFYVTDEYWRPEDAFRVMWKSE